LLGRRVVLAALLAASAACRASEPLLVLAELPEFSLAERSGEPLTKRTLAGRPVVVDRPEVLTRYAEGWQVGPRWLFATGERTAIWELVRKGFLLPVEATPASVDSPILHSNRFALIDRRGRLRATYEAFEEEALDRILADLKALEAES
jgi:cytochrome oxidase Cu insertion factor (SCO1/SenC/PrrC family)